MKRFTVAGVLGAYACLSATAALAQNPSPTDIRACSGIETDAQRLLCYDKAVGRTQMPQAAKKTDDKADTVSVDVATRDSHDVKRPLSLLDSRWELSPESKLGTFNLRGYRPTYVLPVFMASRQNDTPHSPAPDHTVSTPQDLDRTEAKFQISLKTKIGENLFGNNGDLWVGYTQSSRWQVYNKENSRPFRETNYEPELLLAFATNYEIFGWTGRLASIGINHQSNGRADPLSRSWNRVVADIGFEREGWTVMLRPWWRIPEDRKNDDNPDIQDYMGRGEIQVVHELGRNEFALAARHSFRSGDRSHGSLRFTWSFPLVGNLRGFLEAFNGYGESMIDYNHRASYLGVGVSLLDWY
ncbi:phospholipase A [Luteibacter sp. PPL201]|uniref:Phospholipase A1 n=1 Tax=Luteibacter sahnii TaxID=3021977 RepID=A0ABT6BBB1_9GAMM|nr:phospholipase A [Luteibacter sp. PPL193]MDY1547386.1 phospholipase A [Luteibacter sp. PPL193]